jgi:hypothetical protein
VIFKSNSKTKITWWRHAARPYWTIPFRVDSKYGAFDLSGIRRIRSDRNDSFKRSIGLVRSRSNGRKRKEGCAHWGNGRRRGPAYWRSTSRYLRWFLVTMECLTTFRRLRRARKRDRRSCWISVTTRRSGWRIRPRWWRAEHGEFRRAEMDLGSGVLTR